MYTNVVKALTNGGWKSNPLFQDCCLSDLNSLSDDVSSTISDPMSPWRSTLNRLNGFLEHYLHDMMRNPCFGRWISHIISYGLVSSNKKAAQILAKAIISKIDGDEFLPHAAGGTTTSPSNTIHDEFQYSAYASFLNSHCTIDTNIPFIVKHGNAIRLLVAENDNSIWDENVRIEFQNWVNLNMMLKILSYLLRNIMANK